MSMVTEHESPVHLEGKGNEPIDAPMAGSTLIIAVKVGYPGSRVSDILIGDTKVQVPNEDLRAAYWLCDEINDTEGG